MDRDLWTAAFMVVAWAGLAVASLISLVIDAQQPDPASQGFLDCGTTMPRYDDGSDLICRAGAGFWIERMMW